MKKSIALLLILSLHTTHSLMSSQNGAYDFQEADSQATELSTELDTELDTDDDNDAAITWLFSSQNPNNQPNGQFYNLHQSQEEAQINDGYDYDDFETYFHQPTPLNHENEHQLVHIISQDENQNPVGLQRTVRIPHHGQLPYLQRHIISQEADDTSDNN